jgi:hypothetical protein
MSPHLIKCALTAMQVAGDSQGLSVVDKAQKAVNTFKIINALNEISDILKVGPMSPGVA